MREALFPNFRNTLAEYSPALLTIKLHHINNGEVPLIHTPGLTKRQNEKVSIIHHEMRHNIDHISTLWGQNNLLKLYNAMNGRISNNISLFKHIVEYKHEERQLHFAKYFSIQYTKKDWKSYLDNWNWAITSGVRFNHDGSPDPSKPILFIRFAAKSGENLLRVPISIASLLETTATNDEVQILISYVNSLNGDEKLVENTLFNKWLMSSIIYNTERAIYTSVVHLTANMLGLSDTGLAYQIASSIATITLNLPNQYVINIPYDKEKYKEWGDKPINMLRNNEYGFIFHALLDNYVNYYKHDGQFSLPRLLLANNLPNKQDLEKAVLDKMTKNLALFSKHSNLSKFYTTIISNGIDIFKRRGIDGTDISINSLIENGIYTPFILFGDTDFNLTFVSINDVIKSSPIDDISPAEYYSLADIVNDNMDEFYEVRGV